MPEIARFLASHAAIGFALSTGFVVALVLADPGGIGTLLCHPASGHLPLVLLWGFSGLTFGAAQLGFALWLAAED
jgi:hypothetical protein